MPHPLQSKTPLVVRMMRGYKEGLLDLETRTLKNMAQAWYGMGAGLDATMEAMAYQMDEAYKAGEALSPSFIFQHRRTRDLRNQLRAEAMGLVDLATGDIESMQRAAGRRGRDQAISSILAEYYDVAMGTGAAEAGWSKSVVGELGAVHDNKKAVINAFNDHISFFERENEGDAWSYVGDQRVDDKVEALVAGNAHLGKVANPGAVFTDFTRLPREAAEYMVGGTQSGTPLRELLYSRVVEQGVPDAEFKLIGALRQGVIEGKNPRVVAREMQQALGAPLQNAMTIARTEGLRPYREASRAAYQESGVVKRHKRLATKDARTCAACLAADGQKFPTSRTLYDHPNGRCTSIPVVDGLPEVEWQHGMDWLAEQDEATQLSVLGPGRLEAWKDGQLDLRDLARHTNDPTWGGSLQVRPLSDFQITKTPPTHVVRQPPVSRGADWPADLEGLEHVEDLGGTTGAVRVRDPETGKEYVLKRGRSSDHIQSEYDANAAYRAAGVNVPAVRLYEDDLGKGQLMEYVPDGRPLSSLTGAEHRQAVRQLQGDFGMDAALANWDVIGMNQDNVLVDRDGKIWRVDNGGALSFRAQAGMKEEAWNRFPDELWTMRERGQASNVFGEMNWYEVRDSMRTAVDNKGVILDSISGARDRRMMSDRLDRMEDLVGLTDTMEPEGWLAGYVDDMSRHIVGMDKAGIQGMFPGDESRHINHGPWRGRQDDESILTALADYMAQNGGDYKHIESWASSQAASSWSSDAVINKWRLQKAGANGGRGVGGPRIIWGDYGSSGARKLYERQASRWGNDYLDEYEETFNIWNAFNREVLGNVDFEGNNREGGKVRVFRTEKKSVLDRYNATHLGRNTIPRGGAESGSLEYAVPIYGHQMTVYEVPHHRVQGMYWFDQHPGGRKQGLFGSDRENEIVFIPTGLEYDHIGVVRDGESPLEMLRRAQSELGDDYRLLGYGADFNTVGDW